MNLQRRRALSRARTLEDEPLLAEPGPERQGGVEAEVGNNGEGGEGFCVGKVLLENIVEVEGVEGNGDGGVADAELDVGCAVRGREAEGAGEGL